MPTFYRLLPLINDVMLAKNSYEDQYSIRLLFDLQIIKKNFRWVLHEIDI